MGAFLDRPKTEKLNEHGTGNNLRYGLSSMQGWRIEMEDAHSAIIGFPELPEWSFFAVFDGHAGARVSEYTSKNLLGFITDNDDFWGAARDARGGRTPTVEGVKSGVRTGFLNLDAKMRLANEDKSGSTVVCALLSPSHIFFGNCGDSRGVLARNGKLEFGTLDHKPTNPAERKRIEGAGGSVMIQRVNGSLAVSRALGDYEYKNSDNLGPCDQLVSPEPDVTVIARDSGDEFLVLACDGVWDVMSNEDVCDFVRYQMQLTDNLEEVCNRMIDTCLHKGSRDNMSVIVVALAAAPTVSEEMQRRDVELDKRIKEKVTQLYRENSEVDVNFMLHQLSSLDVPVEGLPPGGGIYAKHSVVEATLAELEGPAIKKSEAS